MIPHVYAAKKALFDRLTQLAAAGQQLAGIQVAYAFPGDVGLELVYGGGVRFTHEDAVAERNVLIAETALVSVYIRVTVKRAGAVEETDARCAQIADVLAELLRVQPELTGGMSWAGIAAGQGDYEQSKDETVSILAVQMRVESDLAYDGL